MQGQGLSQRVGGRSPLTRKMCDLFFVTSSPLRLCASARDSISELRIMGDVRKIDSSGDAEAQRILSE